MAKVDRTRVRALRIKIEVDEPDGSVTEVEINGFLKDGNGPLKIIPEYDPNKGGAMSSVGLTIDALLTPIKGEDQARFPLYRMTEGIRPDLEIHSGEQMIVVQEERPSQSRQIMLGGRWDV